MSLGLLPQWAKDRRLQHQTFNARRETVREKGVFREAFKRRRCLVPANGFYEWRTEGKQKTPLLISLPAVEVFAFAGLWDEWLSPGGTVIRTTAIVTTEPNEFISDIHNRMPVILSPEREGAWLDQAAETGDLLSLLVPYAGELVSRPVSPHVDSLGSRPRLRGVVAERRRGAF